jgi:hypothetical protein
LIDKIYKHIRYISLLPFLLSNSIFDDNNLDRMTIDNIKDEKDYTVEPLTGLDVLVKGE